MSRWFIYILRCKFGNLYTGITTDVERRIREHEEGGSKGAKNLRGKAPLTLEFCSEAGNRSRATKLEARIKKLSRIQKEELINGQLQLEVSWQIRQ